MHFPFQMAAVSVVPAILDYLCDDVIRTELLPRARNVYSTNGADVKIVLSLLACIAKVNYRVSHKRRPIAKILRRDIFHYFTFLIITK